MNPNTLTTSPWPRIVLLWLAGVLAAAQLGKMAALAPLISKSYILSLTQTGWLISLLEVSGATLGLACGFAIARIGATRGLLLGLALLAVAGLMQAFAADAGPLFIARFIESGGYLFVVIAAPSLIAFLTPPETRGPALILWSTFVPIGIAVGAILSGAGTLAISWQQICLLWGGLSVVAGVACITLPRSTNVGGSKLKIQLPGRIIWLFAVGFGFYTTVEVGVLGMLPSYLTDIWNMPPTTAGLVTGAASASTVIGSFLAAWWIRHADANTARTGLRIIFAGLIIPAILCVALFTPPGRLALLDAWSISLLAIAINAASGLLPAIVFARLPDLVARADVSNADGIATANGLLAQFGAAGSLIGPPLFAMIAQMANWPSVAPVIILLSVLSAALFACAERSAAVPHAQATAAN